MGMPCTGPLNTKTYLDFQGRDDKIAAKRRLCIAHIYVTLLRRNVHMLLCAVSSLILSPYVDIHCAGTLAAGTDCLKAVCKYESEMRIASSVLIVLLP